MHLPGHAGTPGDDFRNERKACSLCRFHELVNLLEPLETRAARRPGAKTKRTRRALHFPEASTAEATGIAKRQERAATDGGVTAKHVTGGQIQRRGRHASSSELSRYIHLSAW